MPDEMLPPLQTGPEPVEQAALLATIVAIFRRALGQAAIGPQDDFFDLGGDSLLALTVMLEIHEATGQDLPITTIYDASSAAAMTALLQASAPTPRTTCLIQFKPGTGTPLFIAHGLGGSVMELRELARRLDIAEPVYGIEARGLDGLVPPLDRVEDMARFHLDEIRRLQPQGPYRLAGFSFGGLIALEMAQQLRLVGQSVAFLGLLDTYPHTRFWPLGSRLVATARISRFLLSPAMWRWSWRYHARILRSLPAAERQRYVVRRARRAVTIPFDILRAGSQAGRFLRRAEVRSGTPTLTEIAIERVQRAGRAAFAAYCPVAYTGAVDFVKATGETTISFDPCRLWRRLMPGMTVHRVPADHQGLVRGSVIPLAELLSRTLRRSEHASVETPRAVLATAPAAWSERFLPFARRLRVSR